MSNAHYYWRMTKDGPLLGPTLNYYECAQYAAEEIEETMGEEVPLPFIRVAAKQSTWNLSDLDKEFEKKKDEEERKTKEENRRYLREILKEVPFKTTVSDYSDDIDVEVGYPIMTMISYHTIRLSNWVSRHKGRIYHLDDPKQKKKFLKEVEKRIKDRIKREKSNKKVKGRLTKIGRFDNDTEKTVQSAEFEVYLDADQEIHEAEPTLVGKIKFFRKASRRVMFDIDKRKIYTPDGKKEIETTNAGQVIDALIRCLADAKGQ